MDGLGGLEPAADLTAANQALGSINTSAIAAANSGGLGSLDAFTFGEASISFAAIFQRPGVCGQVGSVYMKSRSSTSFQSEIKDFIAPEHVNLSNCVQLNAATTIHDAAHNTVQNGAHLALGSIVHDTAQITGQVDGIPPTGLVTFTFYSGPNCTNGSEIGTFPSPDGVDPRSNATDALAPGSYGFTATIAGDDAYLGDTSDCEPFFVDKAQLAMNSQVHDSAHVDKTNLSVPLGSVMHDTGKITGGLVATFTPEPITFQIYPNGTCAAGSGSAVNNTGPDEGDGTRDRSAASAPLAAGASSYKAFVAGNNNYLGSDSGCEPFTVDKAQLAMNSQVHDSAHVDKTNLSVPLGSVMHDTGKITGGLVATFTPEPITFQIYPNGTCAAGSGSAVNNTGPDEGDGTRDRSAASAPLAAGAWSYKAFVAGNNNYLGSDSGCEPFTVDKAQLAMNSQVHDSAHVDKTNLSVPLGSVMHDTGKITGGLVATFTPEPITFQIYPNGTCAAGSGSAVNNTGPDEGDGTRDRSAASAPLAAGAWSYKAFVAGNNNYLGSDSGCEPFTVDKAQLAMNSQVHDSAHVDKTNLSVPLGSVMHDTGKITGGLVATFTPEPITFQIYPNGTCAAGSGSAVNNTGPDEGDGTRDRSAASAPLAAGAWSYKAFVAGNNNYLGSDSGCEPFTVDKAQLAMNSQVHDSAHVDKTNLSVPLGSVMHDTGKITGGLVATFTPEPITFQIYPNGTCAAGSGSAVNNTGPDEGDGTRDRSAASAPLAAGAWSYKAFMASNNNYLGSDSGCEPFTVDKAQPAMNSQVHDSAHVDKTNLSVPLGSVMHDTGKITGGLVATFTPEPITFQIYPNGTCAAGSGSAVNNTGPDEGDGTRDRSAASAPLAAGASSCKAFVAGNNNYLGSDSGCEPFTVDKAQLQVSTVVHDPTHDDITDCSVPLGSTAHDNATVTGGVAGFSLPAVSFSFDSGAIANNATTEAGFTATSIATGVLAAGGHVFNATVATNANYIGATSAPEPFTVDKDGSSTATELHTASEAVIPLNSSVTLLTSVHDKATATSANTSFPITGTVTFTFFENGACDGPGIDKGPSMWPLRVWRIRRRLRVCWGRVTTPSRRPMAVTTTSRGRRAIVSRSSSTPRARRH